MGETLTLILLIALPLTWAYFTEQEMNRSSTLLSKRYIRLTGLTTLYPVVWVLLFIFFMLQVRWMMGHWPKWGEHYTGHYLVRAQDILLMLGLFCYPLIAIFTLGLGIMGLVRSRKGPALFIALATVISVIFSACLLWFTQSSSFDWFMP